MMLWTFTKHEIYLKDYRSVAGDHGAIRCEQEVSEIIKTEWLKKKTIHALTTSFFLSFSFFFFFLQEYKSAIKIPSLLVWCSMKNFQQFKKSSKKSFYVQMPDEKKNQMNKILTHTHRCINKFKISVEIHETPV